MTNTEAAADTKPIGMNIATTQNMNLPTTKATQAEYLALSRDDRAKYRKYRDNGANHSTAMEYVKSALIIK